MKKLERLTLRELGNFCDLLEPVEANYLKGGLVAIVSKEDFEKAMDNGTWAGGQVDGMGYVAGIVTCYGGSLGMVANAQAELGVTASPGTANNPEVQKYYSSVGGGYSSNTPDSTPWCSAFANYITDKSGVPGTDSAKADSWITWGYPTSNPHPGDIAVAADGSHVGIVESVGSDGSVIMISGNYSHSVKRSECNNYVFRTKNDVQ